jgi:hypothetical protein
VESSKRLRETYEEADLGGNVLAIVRLSSTPRSPLGPPRDLP